MGELQASLVDNSLGSVTSRCLETPPSRIRLLKRSTKNQNTCRYAKVFRSKGIEVGGWKDVSGGL